MDKGAGYGAASRYRLNILGYCEISWRSADGTSVAALKTGQSGVVVLDSTPFYAERRPGRR